jgi:hypothetical protein
MGVVLNLVLKPMLEPMTSTSGDITTSLPTAASLPIMAATSGRSFAFTRACYDLC